jgi:integrase
MAQSAPARAKIPTKIPQPSRVGVSRPAATGTRPGRAGRPLFATGTGRAATRGEGRVLVELECGITVYPARREGDRWRAVWYENGRRRQCEAVAEDKLAAKLAKVTERLQADAPNLERPGADLIAWYLCPDRRPPRGKGARLHRCLSAMVTAGIAAGYLTSPRLKEVHWQAAGRAAPGPQVSIAGETAQFVDPAQIPADADVARLGRALARGRRGDLHELMAATAAYTGLRQGELFALSAGQVSVGARVITVDRTVVEVAGKLYLEAPKGRKCRSTIYPARTPAGYPLAGKIAARIQQARAEQDAGANPLGLMFPSPRGGYWRSSNFDRRVLAPAYQAAGWRDANGEGTWTWHSLRHVFCTTALFCWRLEATDVSCMAGHANVRVTLDMYVGATAGVLDRARTATQ